jgi:hypothetical protein
MRPDKPQGQKITSKWVNVKILVLECFEHEYNIFSATFKSHYPLFLRITRGKESKIKNRNLLAAYCNNSN